MKVTLELTIADDQAGDDIANVLLEAVPKFADGTWTLPEEGSLSAWVVVRGKLCMVEWSRD